MALAAVGEAVNVEIIVVTAAPHVADPLDQAPLIVHVKDGLRAFPVKLAARTWLSRLGVFLVRRYVRQTVEGSR